MSGPLNEAAASAARKMKEAKPGAFIDLTKDEWEALKANQPQENTDRIVWDGIPEGQDSRVLITVGGGVGIESGGNVRVLTAERWHRIARLYDSMAALFEAL